MYLFQNNLLLVCFKVPAVKSTCFFLENCRKHREKEIDFRGLRNCDGSKKPIFIVLSM